MNKGEVIHFNSCPFNKPHTHQPANTTRPHKKVITYAFVFLFHNLHIIVLPSFMCFLDCYTFCIKTLNIGTKNKVSFTDFAYFAVLVLD